MTIKQMLQKQKHNFKCIDIDYTDDNGICWHVLGLKAYLLTNDKFKNYRFFADCPVQTFKATVRKNGTGSYSDEYYGAFSVNSEDLPENITAVENYTCPARKTDLVSNNLTVRDYLQIQKNIKKIYFTRFQLNNCADSFCYWHTDRFDVQELSDSLGFMADLLVDKVQVSPKDESVLQVILLTRDLENWREREKEKEKEKRKEEQEETQRKKKLDKMFSLCVFINFTICVFLGAYLGWHIDDGIGGKSVNAFGFGIVGLFAGFIPFGVIQDIFDRIMHKDPKKE